MVTVDDIAGAIGNAMSATANVTNILPGGVWFGRAPDTPSGFPSGYPYAVFTVKPGESTWYSGNLYSQPHTLSVMAYAPMTGVVSGGGNVGNTPYVNVTTPSSVEQCINAALAWQIKGQALRNAGEAILHVRPLDADGKFDASLRSGKDVFTAGQVFEVLVQGNRASS